MTAAPLFFAVEVDTYTPGTTVTTQPGHGSRPHGTLATQYFGAADGVLTVSDAGYRTHPADPQGVVAYPPSLTTAFAINRALNLDPTASASALSWGSITISNTDGMLNAIAGATNTDGRTVRILAGQKVYDPVRGYWVDPPYSALVPVFTGISQTWLLDELNLTIPIRDNTYWLERPLQTTLYGGNGGLDGGPSLAGTPKPKTRGQVSNITPVLVDAANLIYQINDCAGTLLYLYEGGSANRTNGGDVADLYSGMTASGQYRTCQALGLFQLGNTPSRIITADVIGSFPDGSNYSAMPVLLAALLIQDLGVPANVIDITSLQNLYTANPWAEFGGVFFGPTLMTGVNAVDYVLQGLGMKLAPQRNGQLRVYLLAAPSGSPSVTLSPANVVHITPQALPTTLSPPPYRFRVGGNHNYTVMTPTDISPSITNMTTVQSLGVADYYYSYVSYDTLVKYKKPQDTAAIPGVLRGSGAQTVANNLGALWCTRRRVYAVAVPLSVALTLDFGSTVSLQWNLDDLAAGKLGTVVGEQWRSGDAISTLLVLV